MTKWAKDLNGHFSTENVRATSRYPKRCAVALSVRETGSETTAVSLSVTEKSGPRGRPTAGATSQRAGLSGRRPAETGSRGLGPSRLPGPASAGASSGDTRPRAARPAPELRAPRPLRRPRSPARSLGVPYGGADRKRGAHTADAFPPEDDHSAVRHEDGRGGHRAAWEESGRDEGHGLAGPWGRAGDGVRGGRGAQRGPLGPRPGAPSRERRAPAAPRARRPGRCGGGRRACARLRGGHLAAGLPAGQTEGQDDVHRATWATKRRGTPTLRGRLWALAGDLRSPEAPFSARGLKTARAFEA